MPGLERTMELAEFFGNPQDDFRSIHIAGTNGKGSTAAYIASILMEAGYKVGFYTSPHIKSFNERIKVDGKEIPDHDLQRIAESVIQKADIIGATFFEITTILAFIYFSEQKCDFAVIEAGMGGRFDSTNIIIPEISVITKIDYDHREYLGEFIEQIATEKAGIIKSYIPCVLSKNIENVTAIIEDFAQDCHSKLIYHDNYNISNIEITKDFKTKAELIFNGKTFKLTIPVAGLHQADNAGTAVNTILELASQFKITDENIVNGIENAFEKLNLSSRIELIQYDPPIVVDSAHNPDAVRALRNTIDNSPFKDVKWDCIFSVMNDKNIPEMLELMQHKINNLHIVKLKEERAAKPEVIAGIAESLGFQNIIIENDAQKAFKYLKQQKVPLIIFGSFYLIGETL